MSNLRNTGDHTVLQLPASRPTPPALLNAYYMAAIILEGMCVKYSKWYIHDQNWTYRKVTMYLTLWLDAKQLHTTDHDGWLHTTAPLNTDGKSSLHALEMMWSSVY